MRLRALVYVSFTTIVAALIGAPAQAANSKDFVQKAAAGNIAEVDVGKLALSKASNPEVKAFAQHLVDDHQKAQDDLKQVAQTKGMSVPDKTDAKHKAIAERLRNMSGASFDKAFINAMVKDHKEDVKEFEKQAKSGDDPEIKNYAAQTVAALQQHLQIAESLEQQLQNDKGSK